MILPGRRTVAVRSAALRRGDFPHAEEGAARAQARDLQSATKADSRRTCRRTKPRWRRFSKPSSAPATRQASRSSSASTCAQLRVLQGRRLSPRVRESQIHARASFADYLGDLVAPLSDRHHRRRHGGRRLGRLGTAHAAPRQARFSSSATICSSTNTKILKEGIDKKIANAHSHQGRIRSASLTETLAAIDMAVDAGLRRQSCRIARARPRTRRSPISRSRRARRRSRRARCRARIASPRLQPAAAHRGGAGQQSRSTPSIEAPAVPLPWHVLLMTPRAGFSPLWSLIWCSCSTGTAKATAGCVKSIQAAPRSRTARAESRAQELAPWRRRYEI